MKKNKEVIISGAGPVGYLAALNLANIGVSVTLLEVTEEIADDPRAGTIHPPTLEIFDELGLADTLINRGYVVSNYHYRDRKTGLIANFDLGVLADDTRYPFRLMLEQHKVSGIIDSELKKFKNFKILRQHKVKNVQQDEDGVLVEAETPNGVKEFRSDYLIGCDGGKSAVRRCMNVEFKGFTFEERFLVVTTPYDFAEAGYAFTNYISDPKEWCALFKVPGKDDSGIWRVVFPTDPEQTEEYIFSDSAIERRLQGFHPKKDPFEVIHRNLYVVHQRVASRYRDGKVLLAGDAAHVNNPLGGMGLNFGFHDVINLTHKLGRILLNGEEEDLLNLYDRQRRTVAEEYLQRQSIENKRNMENKDDKSREAFHKELQGIVADPAKVHQYLRRAAMLEGIERERSII